MDFTAITSSIYTLVFGLENISEDGIIVLEDLPNPKGIWNMIGGKLQTIGYSAKLFDAKGLLFVGVKEIELKSVNWNGATCQDRTDDILITSEVLYHLS